MFDWFRKKKAQTEEFPDNEAAFAHACKPGYLPLMGGLIPALVLEEGGVGRGGERTFLIRLAVDPGPRELWSCTLKEAQSFPRCGDLVGFRIFMIASDLPEPANLIGYIACRLDRVLVAGKGWAVSQSYTPKNIKQAIRF
jgi:hypothetical protein